MFNLNCSMLMILAMAMMVVMPMVMAMMVTMMTWSMEQFDPNAVESFIMAGEGTKCCRKTNQININVKTMNKNKQKWNLEHDEVGGPPGEHDDGLVGQGGVHHLVCHKLGV